MTLLDLKRQYRKLYIDILEMEMDRGYTTINERRKLNKLQKAIQEGECMTLNKNLTKVEKELTIDALEKYIEHLQSEGLKTSHDLFIKFQKIINKLRKKD